MPTRRPPFAACALLLAAALATLPALGQKKSKAKPASDTVRAAGGDLAAGITTPKEFFGFNVGDDYQEVNYTKAEAYWKKLATESNRMKMVDIGQTEEGRTEWMMIITSPANLRNLEHYRQISEKLGRAEGLTDADAHALAKEGKPVVWIDGGLHASESVGFQQLVEMIYQMVSRNDPETLRLLDADIGLYVPINPDGSEMVANWYMRNPVPNERTNAPGLPALYNKYVGHDDNRDSYMSNMKETENMNKVLYTEWFPQILYNHHQTGPAGGVIFMPPFRDPFNYNFDPLIPLDIEAVGTAMHQRLVEQNMGGSEMRSGSSYSTWWDGGVRTTAYFHNIIGLLTEIIGDPTPITIPFVPAKQLPTGDWPLPIAPGPWHYRQSIDYEMQNNRAVLDYAARNKEDLLYNFYQMGRNSIQRGNEDAWTITPATIETLDSVVAKAAPAAGRRGARGGAAAGGGAFGGGRGSVDAAYYTSVLHSPETRDPRGYIIPSDQADFATATKFVNALIKNGTEIEKASSEFQVNGKSYPAGSFVVMAAQADRPFVLDMFEPQHYPNDFTYPGGPPIPPYDTAGWTLAYQMGVKFDRELDAFSGPFEKLPFGQLQPMPAATVADAASPAGYLISHEINNSFIVVNRLLKAGADVYWMKTPQSAGGKDLGTGAIYVKASAAVAPILQAGAKDLGVPAYGVAAAPQGAAMKLKPVRIGLYDQYGGSMPSGWVRWMLEQYEFPYEVVYPRILDAGNLRSNYDVLLFVDSGLPNAAGGRGGRGGGRGAPTAAEMASVPPELAARMGSITQAKTIPALQAFTQAGGTVLTIGTGTSIAEALGLPITSYLTEMGANGQLQPLPNTKFYIPGSLMRITIDNTQPVAYGMAQTADVDFDHSPVFRLVPNLKHHAATVAWFNGDHTLDSGWAWGQSYLNGGAAVVSGKIGAGTVYAMGPEITFRAQPHGTFKLLFNGLFAGSAETTTAQ